MPQKFKRRSTTLFRNSVPLSDKICLLGPNIEKYIQSFSAISSAVLDLIGTAYGYFVKYSVITSIPLYPSLVTGRPRTKSMPTLSNSNSGWRMNLVIMIKLMAFQTRFNKCFYIFFN